MLTSLTARRWKYSAALTATAVAVFASLTMVPTSAQAAPPKALINADTVTGGSDSQEATLAASLGFSVDVVDAATWSAMSQLQFAEYQVIIAGDPTCGEIAQSFIDNQSVWAPVVMGTAVNTQAGNRVVVGTDPVFHDKPLVIQSGIDFAGAMPGRTGLYFDTTCGGHTQPGVAASMLAQLSAGTGTWTEGDTPPCGGNVAKIASTPKFDSLTTEYLAGWGCSVHQSFPTFASDWIPLAIATDTSSHPTCGTDETVTPPAAACGEAYLLIAGSGVVVTSPNISLTPATATDPVGTTGTVTANVTLDGAHVVGQVVAFTVTGQNAGATGTCSPAACTTDSAGNVSFSYLGDQGPGVDTIVAQFTNSAGTTQQATATITWTEATAPSGTAVTLTAPGSGTYSQPSTLTAHLQDVTSGSPIAGEFVDLVIGSGPGQQTLHLGPTDAAGNASATLAQLLQPAPSASVALSFGGNTGSAPVLAASAGVGSISVSPDRCTVRYSGDTLVRPLVNTNLSAQFLDANTPSGDLSGHTVTFELTNSAAVASTYTAVTNSTGVASVSVPLTADTYLTHVTSAADNKYAACGSDPATDVLMTVEQAGSKATGGGWAANGVGRFNFGFNVIPQAGGTYTGSLQITSRSNKDKFHGRVVSSVTQLAVNKVRWSGSGYWNGSAATFTVTVTDNNSKSTKADNINVVIKVGSTTVFTTGSDIVIKGGNIIVH